MDKTHLCVSPYWDEKKDRVDRDHWICEYNKFTDEEGFYLFNKWNDNICFTKVKYCPFCGEKDDA